MRRLGSFCGAMTLSVLLLTGGNHLVSGQSSTGVDFSPNPDQCTQEPRPLEGVKAALVASPDHAQSPMAQTATRFQLPEGEEAPSDVRGGIVSTIVQMIACANAGNQLAALAGVTDAFLASDVAGDVLGLGAVATDSATSQPLPEDLQTELLDTREFRVYDDGRAGVLVFYRVPAGVSGSDGAMRIDLLIFTKVGDRWLLDEAVTGLEAVLGDMATPAAG